MGRGRGYVAIAKQQQADVIMANLTADIICLAASSGFHSESIRLLIASTSRRSCEVNEHGGSGLY